MFTEIFQIFGDNEFSEKIVRSWFMEMATKFEYPTEYHCSVEKS